MNMLKVLEYAGTNKPQKEMSLKSIEVPIKIFYESLFKGLTEVSTRTFLTIDILFPSKAEAVKYYLIFFLGQPFSERATLAVMQHKATSTLEALWLSGMKRGLHCSLCVDRVLTQFS